MNIVKIIIIIMIVTYEDNNKAMYTKHIKDTLLNNFQSFSSLVPIHGFSYGFVLPPFREREKDQYYSLSVNGVSLDGLFCLIVYCSPFFLFVYKKIIGKTSARWERRKKTRGYSSNYLRKIIFHGFHKTFFQNPENFVSEKFSYYQ